MMKTITHFISSSGGGRHSLASSALLILLGLFMLLPGVARAEDGTYENFKYTVDDKNEVTIMGFADGKEVSEVVIPSEIDGKPVVTIGSEAFSNQEVIKSVYIPASVEKIDRSAFFCSFSLNSVTFAADSKLKTIGAWAFGSCHNFYSSITIPSSVEEICEYAFQLSWFSSVTFGEDSRLSKIGQNAFAMCHGLSRIEIPSSVSDIGDNLFQDCYSLKEIILKGSPNSGADLSCYGKLLDANSDTQLLVATEWVDSYKEALSAYSDRILGIINSDGLIFKEDETNDGLSCIGFSGDEPKNIVIPAKVGDKFVTSIGKNAFYYCSSLSSVKFATDGHLKTIGENAFARTSLTSVNIPETVDFICPWAFYDIDKLTSVSFAPNGSLKTIGVDAFMSSSLASVTIPASVEEICAGAFADCVFLASVSFAVDGKLRTIGDNAFSSSLLKDVFFPASVEEICAGAFAECVYLSSLSFATGGRLKTIGERAFLRTCLTSVNIPSTVETIGTSAFERVLLETVNFGRCVEEEGNLDQYSSDMFKGCINLTTIYVPLTSKDAYGAQLSDYQDKIVGFEVGSASNLTDEKGLSELEVLTVYDKKQLSYSRKVETTDGEYATVCLPFTVDLSKTVDVFDKVYVPLATMIHDQANSDDTKESFILMLKEQAADAEIPANQPFIVKLADGKDEFTFTNYDSDMVRLSKDMMPAEHNMTVLDWDGASGLMTENTKFNISYSSHYKEPFAASANKGIWSSTAQGTFGPQTEGDLNPFRLFLHVEGVTITSAKAYSIRIGVSDDSTATGIREIISADGNNGASSGAAVKDGIIYDLNGQKVATAAQAKSLPKGIYILNGRKLVINN